MARPPEEGSLYRWSMRVGMAKSSRLPPLLRQPVHCRSGGSRELFADAGQAAGTQSIPSFLSLYRRARKVMRSEEHTSELQSLMRISYAVFCLKKKNNSDYNNSFLHYTD